MIDTATKQTVKTLDVGAGPLSVAANPQRNRVYVSNSLDNTVSVIDSGYKPSDRYHPDSGRARVLLQHPEVSYEPFPYANRVTEVAASGNRLYLNSTDGMITVIDTTNDANTVIRADSLGTFNDLKVSPDGTRLYGTSGTGLTVINTSTDETPRYRCRPKVEPNNNSRNEFINQRWQRCSEPRWEEGLRDLWRDDRRTRRRRPILR